MKRFPQLLISVVSCELVGFAGSFFTAPAIPTWYASLTKPPFSPPNWLFAPVWTTLYFLMGISLFLIWQKGLHHKEVISALKIFFIQLAINFLWSPIFFGLKSPAFGLLVIISMWLFIVLTIKKFYSLSKAAALLLIPYLLWVSFATILNASIVLLN